MTVSQMLDEVRKVIAKCDASELEVYEALMEESEGWQMRLGEIYDEEEKEDV